MSYINAGNFPLPIKFYILSYLLGYPVMSMLSGESNKSVKFSSLMTVFIPFLISDGIEDGIQ